LTYVAGGRQNKYLTLGKYCHSRQQQLHRRRNTCHIAACTQHMCAFTFRGEYCLHCA
jgi:hypothetical protein